MRSGAAALALLAASLSAAAAEQFVTPRAVVYPRQLLHAGMLETREDEDRRLVGAPVARAVDELAGKAARATLLPGRPILLDHVGPPQIVKVGSAVTLVFSAGGVDVRASGVALQAAAAGDTVRARNSQTSVIVTGVLGEDGAVLVSGP